MMASDGSARHRLAELTASVVCRPVWPMHSPIGNAIASAMTSETTEMRDVLVQAHGNAVRARPVGRVGQPRDGLRDDVHARPRPSACAAAVAGATTASPGAGRG